MTIEIIPGIQTEVVVRYKKIKNGSIRVKKELVSNQMVHYILITLPLSYRFKVGYVEDLLKRKYNFLKKALQEENKVSLSHLKEDEFCLFGTIYHVIFDDDQDNIKIINDTIIAKNKEAIIEYGMSELEKYFLKLEEEYHFPKCTLYIHSMKSRWGVCYISKKRIGLAKALIYVPLPLVRFVIIHEFMHLKEANHGPRFHQEVMKYCPDEKRLNKELKKYSEFLYL